MREERNLGTGIVALKLVRRDIFAFVVKQTVRVSMPCISFQGDSIENTHQHTLGY